MTEEPFPRVMLIMVDEETVDNLVYVRDNMQKEFNLNPENVSDVIEILTNYWFEGKRGK